MYKKFIYNLGYPLTARPTSFFITQINTTRLSGHLLKYFIIIISDLNKSFIDFL